MSDQEFPATPPQPGHSNIRPDEPGSLPPFLIGSCVLTGAVFGLATVLLVWLIVRLLPW